MIDLFRFWILEWLSWFQNKQWFFSSVMKCQNNIILNQNLILRLKHYNCICTTLPVYWHHLHPKSNHRQFILRQCLKNYLVEHVNLMMIFLQQGQRSNQVCLLDCFTKNYRCRIEKRKTRHIVNVYFLMVSKFQKQIFLFSFKPKNEQNYFLISALRI